MAFLPMEVYFKYLPRLTGDRPRWMSIYWCASILMGFGLIAYAHKPAFHELEIEPSFFYKQHLKKLAKDGKISESTLRHAMHPGILGFPEGHKTVL